MVFVIFVELVKLVQDEFVVGVIENVIIVNEIFEQLFFDGIDGNVFVYNCENVLGDVQMVGVGLIIIVKNLVIFIQVILILIIIIGDVEVNGLIQVICLGDGNDQIVVQVVFKVKLVGCQYQNQMVNGDGIGNNVVGLFSLVVGSQIIIVNNGVVNGVGLFFEDLDVLIDFVIDKDGQVDYLMMYFCICCKYLVLLCVLGGILLGDVYIMVLGCIVLVYCGILIFCNDWILIIQIQGIVMNVILVFVGIFDDGSCIYGIVGLIVEKQVGMYVKYVGEKEDVDESIICIFWYCGFVLFSEKGLVVLKGVILV